MKKNILMGLLLGGFVVSQKPMEIERKTEVIYPLPEKVWFIINASLDPSDLFSEKKPSEYQDYINKDQLNIEFLEKLAQQEEHSNQHYSLRKKRKLFLMALKFNRLSLAEEVFNEDLCNNKKFLATALRTAARYKQWDFYERLCALENFPRTVKNGPHKRRKLNTLSK